MRSILVISIALIGIAPLAARAQESSAFIVKLGRDTLSLEQFTRTPTLVRGELVVRTPRSLYRSYVMDLRPDGTVKRFELVTRTLDGGPGPAETRGSIEFTGDSAIVTTPRGDTSLTTRMAVGKHAVPSMNGVMGIMDQLGRQAHRAGSRSYAVDLIAIGAVEPIKGTVTKGGGDTLALTLTTSVGTLRPFRITLDKTGRLTAFSGKGTTFQAEARRVPEVNLVAARSQYGSRPLGPLSSRDTVRATLGKATVWVDYGRPSKRGREIFGNVVPWNTVWRTGANAATQFQTSADLVIGDAAVPAGTYTLWTLPSPRGWKLIINRQTGQWGTLYDPARDHARVDLKVENLTEPVETFTISIEPGEPSAMLRMAWDQTRVSVPIRVP